MRAAVVQWGVECLMQSKKLPAFSPSSPYVPAAHHSHVLSKLHQIVSLYFSFCLPVDDSFALHEPGLKLIGQGVSGDVGA